MKHGTHTHRFASCGAYEEHIFYIRNGGDGGELSKKKKISFSYLSFNCSSVPGSGCTTKCSDDIILTTLNLYDLATTKHVLSVYDWFVYNITFRIVEFLWKFLTCSVAWYINSKRHIFSFGNIPFVVWRCEWEGGVFYMCMTDGKCTSTYKMIVVQRI